MIEAYLDESGTHTGSPLVVVAGWVGSREAWKSFIEEWNIHLTNAGISCFHATNPECESLKGLLTLTILKTDLYGVAWSVNPVDFKKNVSDKFMSRFGNAYSTCAFLCAGLISGLAKRDGYGHVALVYEAGQPNADFIHKTITAMITEPEDHRLDSITFMNKKSPGAIPLQAADFLSHVIGINETKWINLFLKSGKLHPPVRMPPEKIKETSKKIEAMIVRQRALRRKSK